MNRKKELQQKLYSMTTQIHDDDAYQQSIWRAIADALGPIDKTVKETVDGIFIDKSTWELDFWEELYGLEPLGSIEDRKSAVKSNIRMNPTMTTEVFENIISSWKGAEVEVEEFYDEYRIEVRFTDPDETPDDMDALVDFMYEILPAHLAMSVGYKYIRIKDVHNKLTSKQMERLAMSTFATPEDYEVDGGYYTDRLDLYNRDPIDDADRLFDLQAMLNDNWDKVDKNVALLKDLDKHIGDNNNPHNVTSDQVTTIKRMPSDARLIDYPDGVTVFYTNVIDDGYPHRYGNVLTATGQSSTTGFQLFALNNFNASRRKIYVRYYHGDADKGWSDWFKLADSFDLEEIKNSVDNLTKKDIGLGNVDNVKQASKAEFDDHTKALGNYQSAGHVKLSNATNSQSSVSDGVAATPKAVKDAYDHAGDAHTKIKKHEDNKNNPHKVTKAQVGLGNVANYKVASEAQAMAGTSNATYMTPLRTSQYVKEISGESAAGVLAELNDHKNDSDNPHKVTKTQVGLGNVANYKVATKAQAELAKSNDAYMTPLRVLEFLKVNGVNSVAGVKRDKDGNVPLTIADLTMDDYLPPTAPPRDYPVGITSFRTNATQAKEWGDLVGDSIVNTRFLVMTIKASSVWQSAQFIFGVDGYANTGNTIRHRNLYVRSTMASNQSTSNDWSDPIKIVDDRDLSDAIKKLTKSDVGLGNVTNVKQATKAEFDKHTNDKSNPHEVTKAQVGLGNVENVQQATKKEFDSHVDDKTNPHNVTAEQVTMIEPKKSSVLMDTYPDGVTMFYFEEAEAEGYPHRIGTVLTAKGVDKTAFQVFARNGFNRASEHIWYRTGHITKGWSEWHQVMDEDDYSDLVSLMADIEKELERKINDETTKVLKRVNEKISELDSEDINVIDAMPSDAPLTDYPKGVSTFYINVTDTGYPHQYGTVTTYVGTMSVTGYQTFVLNNFNVSRRKIYIRYYHDTPGWSEWYEIADNRDIDEVKGLVEQAQKTADEAISKIPKLSSSVTSTSTSVGANSYAVKQAYDRASEALQAGVKQKQATADSLTSIGASLPDDPTWDELQNEIKKADYVREAEVTLSKGQTSVALDFYPTTISGRSFTLEGENYFCVKIGREHYIFREGAYKAVSELNIVGKTIKMSNSLSRNIELSITGVAKQ